MRQTKEQRHQSYLRHRETSLRKSREYYHAHRAERLAWYHKNKVRINEQKRARRKNHPTIATPRTPYNPLKAKEERKRTKQLIVSHYGGNCRCCGETNIKFLTIDHINDDGFLYRKNHKSLRSGGFMLYKFLIKNNFPTNVQLQCFNCNIGRRNNGGICPHKE